jgi:acyl carrier protein
MTEKPTARDGVEEQIFRLLRDSLYLQVEDAELDLIESGMLDSAMFLTLFVEMERAFRVRMHVEDFQLDNFRSVTRMADFVTEKQQNDGS